MLKFRGVKEVADIFAGWLYNSLLEELAELAQYREQGGKIIIVSVPLSKKRFHQRGYNQSEEIARRLAELEPKIFRLETGNLIKTRETPSQVSCGSRAKRLENLKGAFRVKNNRIFRGRTVLLIDDVTTTGATLAEASHAFGRARPRRIIKIAVAG
ncbi:MAG: phosphoribosyltransferase family protein [Candidatus Vogelbacteria bacterium]|nr:phosphoribosyltransferase family protein [Candidatus Vogelbacteria bacterium]